MECTICLLPFDLGERAPRLLPCAHTYCTSCLNELVAAAGAGRSINCPECRKEAKLPQGVAGLQRNFAIQQLLSGAATASASAAGGTGQKPQASSADSADKPPHKPSRSSAAIVEAAAQLNIPVDIYTVMKDHFSLGINVVCLADDSGSMNTVDAHGRSRWDELKETYERICDIVGHFDDDGFELRFLNRPPSVNVKTVSQVQQRFQRAPEGSTNLIDALESIYNSPTCHPRHTHKKLLVIVMTDGLPDGNTSKFGKRRGDLRGVMQLIEDMHSERGFEDQLFCSFVMCTEEDDVVAQYNEWDDRIPNFDVVDDYDSERREITAKRGADFKFDRNDYIAKIVLGSMDPYFDNLDEAGNFFSEGKKKPTTAVAQPGWMNQTTLFAMIALVIAYLVVFKG